MAKKPTNPQTPPVERVAEDEINEIMAKYDRESAFRTFTGYRGIILSAVLILFSLFQLYSTWKIIPSTHMRPIHVGVVTMLAFLLYPARRKGRKDKLPWYDLALALLSLLVFLYPVLDYAALTRAEFADSLTVFGHTFAIPYQHIIGLVGLILLLEACRRVVGLPIVVIALAFIVFGLFGEYMPGFLRGPSKTLWRIVEDTFYTQNGIFGTPIGASSTFIFLFILFGAFLDKTGVGQFFIDLSNAVAGHKRGGPAKVAVITSALEGTVSGSSVANTVGSGSFTIPMMKKLGYRPEFAAAAEASASTGGQIMPPVMGAAAFLMCDALGVPYTTIVKAAIIPALLYFFGIWVVIDFEARKQGLRGLSKSEMPRLGKVLVTRGYLILPLVAIIYALSAGYTYTFAPLVGILCAVLGSYVPMAVNAVRHLFGKRGTETFGAAVKRSSGMRPKDYLAALEGGARSIIGVALACGVAGVISGMITLTNIGGRMSTSLSALANGNVFLILIFTMIASIILGMGVPTTANYLITSTMMAGVVAKAINPGVPTITTEMLLPAHMFTFYFGIVADITPPVALAAMAGAAIAKSDPLKTGVESTKLAIAAFVVPFIFVLNPQMLMINATWYDVTLIAVTAIIGMIGLGAAVERYWLTKMSWYESLMSLAGGLLMVIPGWQTDIAGFVLIAAVFILQRVKRARVG